jgi:hypothetical protein
MNADHKSSNHRSSVLKPSPRNVETIAIGGIEIVRIDSMNADPTFEINWFWGDFSKNFNKIRWKQDYFVLIGRKESLLMVWNGRLFPYLSGKHIACLARDISLLSIDHQTRLSCDHQSFQIHLIPRTKFQKLETGLIFIMDVKFEHSTSSPSLMSFVRLIFPPDRNRQK